MHLWTSIWQVFFASTSGSLSVVRRPRGSAGHLTWFFSRLALRARAVFAFIRINGPLRQVNVFQPVSATSTLPPFGRALPNTLLLSIRNTVGGDVVKDLRVRYC